MINLIKSIGWLSRINDKTKQNEETNANERFREELTKDESLVNVLHVPRQLELHSIDQHESVIDK